MAAKKKKKTARKAAPRETLIVGSKVKAYIKSKGYKCAGDMLPALSDAVHDALDAAMSRCEANRRSTVRPQDL